jgi:hypothetical protein
MPSLLRVFRDLGGLIFDGQGHDDWDSRAGNNSADPTFLAYAYYGDAQLRLRAGFQEPSAQPNPQFDLPLPQPANFR